MRVVVGIATHNNEDTIKDTLLRLDNQIRKPDKIVVCDKSTDSTPRIIKEFETDIPIKLIKQDGDSVGDAYQRIYNEVRNDGADVLAIIETEHFFDESWLDEHIKLREEFNVDLVAAGPIPAKTYIPNPRDPYFYEGDNMSITLEALDKVGGWDRNFKRGSAWDIQIRLAYAGIKSVRSNRPYSHKLHHNDRETFAKAKKKPSSLMFLAKYKGLYLWYAPEHIIGDLMALTFIVCPLLFIITQEIYFVIVALIIYLIFYFKHKKFGLWFSLKKLVFNGVAVLLAPSKIFNRKYEWNKGGLI